MFPASVKDSRDRIYVMTSADDFFRLMRQEVSEEEYQFLRSYVSALTKEINERDETIDELENILRGNGYPC